jgi:fluoroquinolone transport system ATP-binding protein
MITVRDITFTYPRSDVRAVDGIDFEIAEGEIFGLLGPSGAGKSTTQNILIGLLKGYGGSVQIFGREVHDHGPEFYERVGVSFELPRLAEKAEAIFRTAEYLVASADILRLVQKTGDSSYDCEYVAPAESLNV